MSGGVKEDWVTVYKAAGYHEAEIVKGLLESNGIPGILIGNAAPSVHSFTVDGLGEVAVRVAHKDAPAALKLIYNSLLLNRSGNTGNRS